MQVEGLRATLWNAMAAQRAAATAEWGAIMAKGLLCPVCGTWTLQPHTKNQVKCKTGCQSVFKTEALAR